MANCVSGGMSNSDLPPKGCALQSRNCVAKTLWSDRWAVRSDVYHLFSGQQFQHLLSHGIPRFLPFSFPLTPYPDSYVLCRTQVSALRTVFQGCVVVVVVLATITTTSL